MSRMNSRQAYLGWDMGYVSSNNTQSWTRYSIHTEDSLMDATRRLMKALEEQEKARKKAFKEKSLESFA